MKLEAARKWSLVYVFIMGLALFSGCALFGDRVEDVPPRERVLLFDRPFDVTYLRTLEALNTFPGWVLEQTDKEKGLIVLRNRQYSHLFDKDKMAARFLLKRVNRQQTSVELDPSSPAFEEEGVLLDRIDQVMKATSTRGAPS